jgi:hypothetical protein
MLVTMQLSIFCLPVCYLEKLRLKFSKLILPVVLCGCEVWSLTLREEHILRVIVNRVLRRIFEPRMDEVRGESRKLRNVEFHYL